MSTKQLDISAICAVITGYPLDKVIVFDTETTGLEHDDEILSISACDGYGHEVFDYLVRPTHHTNWPEARHINGISPGMVRDAPTIDELTPRIREVLLDDRLIVGYNAQFDINILWNQGVIEEYPRSTFDVMREYAKVHGDKRGRYGGYTWTKLASCAEHYGYEFTPHDSLEDVKATCWCFRALLCDRKWLSDAMDTKVAQMKSISVSQTKATSENVLKLVESGRTSTVDGELRLGQVTRGRNKGANRYECFIGDDCVGVTSTQAVDRVRAYLALDADDDLPERVRCKAVLSMSGSSAHARVEMSERHTVEESVYNSAKFIRDRDGLEWRKIQKTPQPTEPWITSETTLESSNGEKDGNTSCSCLIVAIVVVSLTVLFALMLFN